MNLQTACITHQILLADDHVPFRQELKKIIVSAHGYEVAGEAGDGPELFSCLGEANPDLVVLDISMPRFRAREAVRAIRKHYPRVKVLMMIMGREKEYLTFALEAGAHGVLLKQDAAREFLPALEQILGNHIYLPPQMEGPQAPGTVYPI